MEKLRPTVKRNLSLFSIEGWAKGYGQYFQEIFGQAYPIIFYYDGQKVNFYHRLADFEKFKKVFVPQLIQDDTLCTTMDNKFQQNVQRLKSISSQLTLDKLSEVHDLIGKIMSYYIFVVGDSFVEARPTAWESRHMSEGVLYEVDEQVEQVVGDLLERQAVDRTLAHVLRLNEIQQLIEKRLVPSDIIAQRQKKYIYINQHIIIDQSFVQYCSDHDFENPEDIDDQSAVVQGTVAFPGRVEGLVRMVMDRRDLDKVQTGEVLVSIMTNATFTPVMNKISAIVTDEGGITCHAAIIARELKIPCITGTKNATKVLRDGDRVEVNATTGIVKKLS